MARLPHRIRRQRWELRAGSTAAAFALRQRLREEWQEMLLPAFETVFDQEVPGEEMIRLPRIELRLKVGAGEDTEALWPAAIHEQLLEQLREILRTHRVAQDKPTEWKQSTARGNRFQSLLHYLQTGSVPWEAAGLPVTELVAELQETCRKRLPEVAALLRAERAPSLAFCFRLLQLLPAAQARAAAREIFGETSFPWQVLLLEALASLLAPEQKYFARHTQLQLAALLLSEALSARWSETVPDFVRSARNTWPIGTKGMADFIASLPAPASARQNADSVAKTQARTAKEIAGRTEKSRPEFSPAVPGLIRKEEPPARGNAADLDAGRDAGDASPSTDEAPSHASTSAVSLSKEKEEAATSEIILPHGKESSPSFPSSAGVFPMEEPRAGSVPSATPSPFQSAKEAGFPLRATHAGLVLLHPFLPRFFEATGLKEKNIAELLPSVLPHAAALLHFLATGQETVYECDLVLIKVLLGVHPDDSLCVAEGLLTDLDREEAEGLLQAAITQWTALKNTSSAGLRTSFLHRSALLREEENGWRLQLERQPFDLLLEYLPWSITVIKLPWMKRPLYLEW